MPKPDFNIKEFKKELTDFIIGNYEYEKIDLKTTMNQGTFHYSGIPLNLICKKIINDKKIGSFFLLEELKEKILDIILKGFNEEKNTDITVENILDFLSQDPDDFFCMIPIHGLNLKKKISLNDVSLYPIKDRDEVLNKNVKNEFKNQILDNLKNSQDFAAVKVKSIIPSAAISDAIDIVNNKLNLIKFIINNTSYLYQMGIGKEKESPYDKEFLAVSKNEGLTQRPFKYIAVPIDIDEVFKQQGEFISLISMIQDKVVNKRKPTPLEKSLVNSINLISNGLYEESNSSRLIQIMAAIEALVEQKTFTQSLTIQISERTAFLLGVSFESRKNIYKNLIKLYDKRSKLSHGELIKITDDDVSYLWNMAIHLVSYLADNLEFFSDSNKQEKKGIKEFVLNKKFELKDDE